MGQDGISKSGGGGAAVARLGMLSNPVPAMNEPFYHPYAFVQPTCRTQEIGAGIDSRFPVERIGDGPVIALASRIDSDQFALERLQGGTAEQVCWLKQIAARHNEIICQAAKTSAVFPLPLVAAARTRERLQTALSKCRSTVFEFLRRFGDRQEWSVTLFLEEVQFEPMAAHAGPPRPHHPLMVAAGPSTRNQPARAKPIRGKSPHEAAARKKTSSAAATCLLPRQAAVALPGGVQLQVDLCHTLQTVEQRLARKAEHCRRIQTLPGLLTGRSEPMVFSAAFLMSALAQESWLETIERVRQDVRSKHLVLEVTGPWPPYHFCPSLDL